MNKMDFRSFQNGGRKTEDKYQIVGILIFKNIFASFLVAMVSYSRPHPLEDSVWV